MSREKLGELLGVSGRTVSYWERWMKVPDPSRSEQLRKVLRLSDMDVWRITHHAAAKVVQVKRKGVAIW